MLVINWSWSDKLVDVCTSYWAFLFSVIIDSQYVHSTRTSQLF